MARRPHGDVAWQPAEPRRRRRRPWLLILIGAAIALAGYMGLTASRAPDAPTSQSSAGADVGVDPAAQRKPVRQRGPRPTRLSTAPRASPAPREAARPQPSPPPRGEMHEAAR